MAKDVLYSEEFVVGKEKKPSDKELDEMVESISSASYGAPKENEKPIPEWGAKKKEKKEPVDNPFGKSSKGYSFSKEESQTDVSDLPLAKSQMAGEEVAEALRAEREDKWRREGRLPNEGAIEATYRKASANPLDVITGAKGYLSENKLKLEASRYGISPQEFETLKGKTGGLAAVKKAVDLGKKREAQLKKEDAYAKRIYAETRAIEATAAKREQTVSQANMQQQGKMVQFGSNNFGQSPVYITGKGTHGAVREKFLPGQGTGVATSLSASRLELARMKQRVLSGPRGSNAVQLLQPTSSGQGAPSTVLKLASTRSNTVYKLSSFTQPRPGLSVLDKLGFRPRKP